MHERAPLISIIIAVFNGKETIEKTIQSVICQTYKNTELIIIDGNSTDGSVEKIHKYDKHIDYWISEDDSGIYEAWNKGIKKSSGEWIGFLGSGDVYLNDALNMYVNTIDKNTIDIDYITSKINIVNKDDHLVRSVGRAWNWKTFKNYMNVAHVGSLHARSLFEKHGYFNENYKIVGDYEFLYRAGSGINTAFVDTITVHMLDGGVSTNIIPALIEAAKVKTSVGGMSYFNVYIFVFIALCKRVIKIVLWRN